MSPTAKRNLTLAATIIGVAVVLGLLIWAVSAAVGRYNLRSEREFAQQHYKQGMDAFNQQDYVKAEADFNAARTRLPDSPEAALATKGLAGVCVARGLDAYMHNDPGGALNYYNQALGYDRTNASAWVYLGNLKSDQGDPITALKAWQNAINNDRNGTFGAEAKHNSAIADLDLGQRALKNSDMSLAHQYWQKASETDPGSEAALHAQENLSAASPSDNTVVSNR